MIAAIIVGLSILLAALFTLAYYMRPGLKEQIEHPKHVFQEQVRQYNQQCNRADSEIAGDSDEF